MPAKPRGKIESLALAVAVGTTVRAWAKSQGVSERTAYQWSGTDEFKARVQAIQNALVKSALGKLAGTSTKAVVTLKKLLVSESDKVRLGAAVNLLRLLIDVRSHAELTGRIEQLEKRLNEPQSPP